MYQSSKPTSPALSSFAPCLTARLLRSSIYCLAKGAVPPSHHRICPFISSPNLAIHHHGLPPGHQGLQRPALHQNGAQGCRLRRRNIGNREGHDQATSHTRATRQSVHHRETIHRGCDEVFHRRASRSQSQGRCSVDLWRNLPALRGQAHQRRYQKG